MLHDLSFLQKPFVQYYLFALIVFVPVARIFQRAGIRPVWTALLATPDVGLVLCTLLLALKKWPQEE